MRRVKLFTVGGGFVVAGSVPPFLPGFEAEILIWGIRTFKLVRGPDRSPVTDKDDAFAYMEVFSVALVITE